MGICYDAYFARGHDVRVANDRYAEAAARLLQAFGFAETDQSAPGYWDRREEALENCPVALVDFDSAQRHLLVAKDSVQAVHRGEIGVLTDEQLRVTAKICLDLETARTALGELIDFSRSPESWLLCQRPY